MKKKGIAISVLFLLMFSMAVVVFAEDKQLPPEEVQWTVSLTIHLKGGTTSGTVTVWATSGSQAEERGKQKWLDDNPRRAGDVISIAANATRR